MYLCRRWEDLSLGLCKMSLLNFHETYIILVYNQILCTCVHCVNNLSIQPIAVSDREIEQLKTKVYKALLHTPRVHTYIQCFIMFIA